MASVAFHDCWNMLNTEGMYFLLNVNKNYMYITYRVTAFFSTPYLSSSKTALYKFCDN